MKLPGHIQHPVADVVEQQHIAGRTRRTDDHIQ
jgi:hypothetical protein